MVFNWNRLVGLGLVATLLIGVAVVAGCGGGAGYEGPERVAVQGTVTLDGNPLPYGTITFLGSGDSARGASARIENGSYSIPEEKGPNVAKYRVTIFGHGKAPTKSPVAPGEEEEDVEVLGEGGGESELGPQIVPGKYNSETTLEVEITSGPNTHDFSLTTK